MPISMTQDNQTYYFHYDQVGTLRLVTDINNNIIKEVTYDTFGNILHDTNINLQIPFGFAGGMHDRDTELVHFGYREYDPFTGKWTAKDPIGFDGGDSNLYGYVSSDPINFVDPTGLIIWFLLTSPTDIAPNELVMVDKNGKKYVYNFDNHTKRSYYDKKKLKCSTQKDDGSDKLRNQDLVDADPKNKPPSSRSKGNKWWNILEILDKMGIM